MDRLIPMIIVLPLIVFWVWMFWDMTNNDDLPGNSTAPLTWPPSSKFNWTLAFIFLSVFAAFLYYFNESRNRY
jgi:uncharacterized membrane protein (DUF4010 family)